jgi:hypothetical protein
MLRTQWKPDELISRSRKATGLGISRRTTTKWLKNPPPSVPRPFRRGTRWVYLAAVIDDWAQRQSPRAQIAPAGTEPGDASLTDIAGI